jgi:transposase-like protein
MSNELPNKVFNDETKAREWLERHLWADGQVCSHCGTVNSATAIETRPGLYQCNSSGCRKQFTVMTGTLFERSHIPLNKWLMAAFLTCASKKGMSAHQMHRIIGISYKSTWFMMHRIREAMRDGEFPGAIGGQNKVVEADETYLGGKAKNRAYEPEPKKQIVMSLVERGGEVRSFHRIAALILIIRIKLNSPLANMLRSKILHAPVYPLWTRPFDAGRSFVFCG